MSYLPGTRKDTQLEDQCQLVYNEKYGAWIPSDVDPDEWAKENPAGPPPPPKSSAGTSESAALSGALDRDDVASKASSQEGGISAPQTPLASQGDGAPSAPATGGRFSARGGAAGRRSTRSRYVDTFNPTEDAAPSDRDLMPPPAARKPAAPPAYKIFTPQKAADDDGQ